MTENIEAAELRAQLAECQRIISAQADTIAGLRKDLTCCHSHNEMMVQRAKKAEQELMQFRADVLAREARTVCEARSLTDEQILAIAYKHGFLGALDVVLDRASAIQYARLVIEAYETIRRLQ